MRPLTIKQYFKGWGFILQGELRKKRKDIQAELSELEEKEEIVGLSPSSLWRKAELIKENLTLLDQEETYWYNRSHESWLLKGDSNTKFFHKCANGRRRKNKIISLERDGTIVEGEENLLSLATGYYKDLFGPEPEYNIKLDPSIWANCNILNEADNEILCQPFSEAEIKAALSQMVKNKAPGPDKIPIEFYQCCWGIVKDDILDLFNDFHRNKVDISRINYGIITLLPKIKDASKMQQFRPICLLNCLYKLITKVLTIRLGPYAEKLIHKNQTAFMKGRGITSGIMCLHEILHETKRRKEIGVIFKIDFEKAYDKVRWNLLFECLSMRGFNSTWCGWIKQVVAGGTVSIKVNDSIGPYIKSFKGVRHGDPLSPILFNFIADCLTRMVERAQDNKLFTGFVDNIIPNGVAILQYADDTIICLKHDVEGARNMKMLLYLF